MQVSVLNTVDTGHEDMIVSQPCSDSLSFQNLHLSKKHLYPCTAMLVRYYLCAYVCPCIPLSQASIVLKPLHELSWFWHTGFPCLSYNTVSGKFGYLSQWGSFPVTFPNSVKYSEIYPWLVNRHSANSRLTMVACVITLSVQLCVQCDGRDAAHMEVENCF